MAAKRDPLPGFSRWLVGWLRRHPLKTVPSPATRGYVEDVMARVRALGPHGRALEPSRGRPAVWPAWLRPWLAAPGLAAGLAIALVAVGLGLARHWPASGERLARTVESHAELLAEVQDGPDDLLDELPDEPVEALHAEMERVDRLMLAEETGQTSREWIEQALELLERLDESDSQDEPSGNDEDEWLEELRRLDQQTIGG